MLPVRAMRNGGHVQWSVVLSNKLFERQKTRTIELVSLNGLMHGSRSIKCSCRKIKFKRTIFGANRIDTGPMSITAQTAL